MNACFEQFLHANRRQNSSFCLFFGTRVCGPKRDLQPGVAEL